MDPHQDKPSSPHPSIEVVAGAVRRGERSAQEIVAAALDAHRQHGPSLNAYVEWDGERARALARQIDRTVAKGQDPGPLAGIPVSVKDLYGVEGLPTRAGTVRPLPSKWEREGFLVRALKQAGAIVVGKTHTVELAFGGVGMNPHHGTPVNPWDRTTHRVPGGSSSGAGVSLVEGSALIAVGSDTGGSIRIPASMTGTVGHKQTTGRWPTDGVVPLSSTLDAVGYLTRTVADTAYVFRAIDPAGTGGSVDSDIGKLRLGVVQARTTTEADEGVRRVLEEALEGLRLAGAETVDVPGGLFDEAVDLYLGGGLISAECADFLSRELPAWPPLLDPIVARRLDGAFPIDSDPYREVLRRRQALMAESAALFDGVDLLVTPTVSITPPPVARLNDMDRYIEVNRAVLSGTCPVNLLDLCAITLPVGLDDAGMPVGMQLIGSGGADVGLLDWGLVVEAALGTSVFNARGTAA